MDVAVGPMTRAELDVALDWAHAEGWNPGVHDADAFWAADPRGFFATRVEGEVVATLAAVRFGSTSGFLGLYITRPDVRGEGYGLQVWGAGRAHLVDRLVGLDAVVEQEATYRRDGFTTAYRTTRFALPVLTGTAPPSGSIVGIASVTLDELSEYERSLVPAPRDAFLAAWVSIPGCGFAALVDDGRLRGWGLRRPCGNGEKLGPLFADDVGIAEDLLRALALGARPPLFLDVPEPNDPGVELARGHGGEPVFSTVRMYDGPPPALALGQVFGVTTLELG